MRSKLDLPSIDPADAIKTAPLVYKFTSATAVGGQMQIVLLPTRPLHPGLGVRIVVSLDDGPLQVLDYATIGRSDEWRNNVLSNTGVRTIPLKMLYPGSHELKVYAIDPGAMIDRIEVDLDGATKHYGALAGN